MILKEFLDKCSTKESVCIIIANAQFESFCRPSDGLKNDFKGLQTCEIVRFFTAPKNGILSICVVIECEDLNMIRGI